MKSTRIGGRVLAVCLPLVALLVGAWPSTSAPASVRALKGLSIQHSEGRFLRLSSVSPEVSEVRLAIQREYLALGAEAQTSEVVRSALSRYGARVSESSVPLGYALVWNAERGRWEVVCTLLVSFAVSFGQESTVVVEARDGTVLY